MATESEDMVQEDLVQMVYFDRPISRAILDAIGNSRLPLSQVVSSTGYLREEVATWLLDMEINGLISHSIEVPNKKSEAAFKLSSGARLLLHRLAP